MHIMSTYCCTLYDDNARLIASFCLVNLPGSDLHCPRGWMETLVNVCTACPTNPTSRDELVSLIERDAPGTSQYAVFEDDPGYFAPPDQASDSGSSDQSDDSGSSEQSEA
jgi:hypothetical protein